MLYQLSYFRKNRPTSEPSFFVRPAFRVAVFTAPPFCMAAGFVRRGLRSGKRWIRTTEGVRQQIYSLPHLATLVSSHLCFHNATVAFYSPSLSLLCAPFLLASPLFWPRDWLRSASLGGSPFRSPPRFAPPGCRADGGIRTPDQLITNQLLWPTELHRQRAFWIAKVENKNQTTK